MSISLSKGEKVNLTKAAEEKGQVLNNVVAAAGWDGVEDVDLMAVHLDEHGKAIADENGDGTNIDEALTAADSYDFSSGTTKGAKHTGDNRTGAGDGDDETIDFTLSDVPAHVKEVALFVVSYGTDGSDGKTLGEVEGTFARILNDGTELAKYKLTDNYPSAKAAEFGRLTRTSDGWEFKATGTEIPGSDLKSVLEHYGITGL